MAEVGNQVIIAGARAAALTEVTKQNPGMQAMTLDIEDPGAIRALAQQASSRFPNLNIVVYNAGIMCMENLRVGLPSSENAS